jgi:hypothetical protein
MTAISEAETQELPIPEEHVLIIPSKVLGDERVVWDPDDKKSLEKAKERFKELIRAGWAAFKLQRDLTTGDHITEFDPKAKKILMVAPMQGG